MATVAVAVCAPAERSTAENRNIRNFENMDSRFDSFRDDSFNDEARSRADFETQQSFGNRRNDNSEGFETINRGFNDEAARGYENSKRNTEEFRFRVLNNDGVNTRNAGETRTGTSFIPALVNDNYEIWSRNSEAVGNSWSPLSLDRAVENSAATANSAGLTSRTA